MPGSTFIFVCPGRDHIQTKNVSKDQVHDHQRDLNIHTSTGPSEMHLTALREQADVVAKPLLMIFERLWQSGKVPGDKKICNTAPNFKNGRKYDPGNYLSASAWCLGR